MKLNGIKLPSWYYFSPQRWFSIGEHLAFQHRYVTLRCGCKSYRIGSSHLQQTTSKFTIGQYHNLSSKKKQFFLRAEIKECLREPCLQRVKVSYVIQGEGHLRITDFYTKFYQTLRCSYCIPWNLSLNLKPPKIMFSYVPDVFVKRNKLRNKNGYVIYFSFRQQLREGVSVALIFTCTLHIHKGIIFFCTCMRKVIPQVKPCLFK